MTPPPSRSDRLTDPFAVDALTRASVDAPAAGWSARARRGSSMDWGRMRAGGWILGAATALAPAAAPAAAVAPGSGWGPDVRLGSSVDASKPALAAMSLDDDAIVGWTR